MQSAGLFLLLPRVHTHSVHTRAHGHIRSTFAASGEARDEEAALGDSIHNIDVHRWTGRSCI